MINLILDDFFEYNNEEIDEYFKKCEKCRQKVPHHVVLCWNCGKVVDKSLLKILNTPGNKIIRKKNK